MNNLAEDVDKCPPNEGLVFVGTSEPHTSEPHTSEPHTALQDTCVCLFVCLFVYLQPYTVNLNAHIFFLKIECWPFTPKIEQNRMI